MIRLRPRVELLEHRLAPAIATWDGGGADNLWSTPANWVGDVGPVPGDDLVFRTVLRLINVNDFAAGTNFGSLSLRGLGFELSGNEVTLGGGINAILAFANPAPNTQISLPITLAADQSFSLNSFVGLELAGQITLNGYDLIVESDNFPGLTFSGAIVGSGTLTKIGNGTATLVGTNTYDGLTTVTEGFLTVTGSVGTVALAGGGMSGTGTTGPLTNSGGNLFPGEGFPDSGVLTTGDFQQTGGAIWFSPVAGVPNTTSRLDARGSVRLGGRLDFSVNNDVHLQPGESFVLISNDGTDPVVGSFADLPEGGGLGFSFDVSFKVTYRGGDGNDVVITTNLRGHVGRRGGAGGAPVVQVYDANGALYHSILAYPSSFTGGVRVVVADATGDGVPDIITAPGVGGGPVVRVWDGVTFILLREFNAYDPAFRGGVFIAAADVTGDRRADIATGAGAGGGPHVKLFNGATGDVLSSFLAYDPQFLGGVSVAVHETVSVIFGGGTFPLPGSIVTGAGPGGGPHVRVFNASTAEPGVEFLAYNPAFTGGVNVAIGTVGFLAYGSGQFNIVTAPASQGGPNIRLFRPDGSLFDQFLAYDASFVGGGVTIATVHLGVGFAPILLTGAGPGGGPHVKQWQYHQQVYTFERFLERSFFAFDPSFTGGVFVG